MPTAFGGGERMIICCIAGMLCTSFLVAVSPWFDMTAPTFFFANVSFFLWISPRPWSESTNVFTLFCCLVTWFAGLLACLYVVLVKMSYEAGSQPVILFIS